MHLYAELLLHIRTVIVSATLADASNSQTTARLSDDRSFFILQHRGRTSKIRLPLRISPTVPLMQSLPSTPSDQLVFRLPLENGISGVTNHLQNYSDILTPWSANTLVNLECIHCKSCRRDIVRPFIISLWKDLPSENWAEMMDFWHCHKPHVHADGDAPSKKGYAAANHLSAQPGVGFVDTSTFLLSKQDCTSLNVANSNITNPSRPELSCEGCGSRVGVVDDVVSGWRLFKSQLALGFQGSVQLHQYSLELWVGALLLSAAEVQAVKKLIVHDSKDHAQSVLIWLFTPDLWISSSEQILSAEPSGPVRATKVLWKPFDAPEHNNSSTFETIDLASEQFKCLTDSLSINQTLLPLSGRQYQDWEVSFLQRFRSEDVGVQDISTSTARI